MLSLPDKNTDLRFLLATARTLRLGIVLLALLTLGQYGAGLAVPWLSGQLTSVLLQEGATGGAVLHLIFAALALALVIQGALAAANLRHAARLQMGASANMQVRLYAHLQSLPLDFYHQRRTGTFLSLLNHDLGQIAAFVSAGLGPALPQVLTFLAALALMIHIDWMLGVIAGLAVPLFFLSARLFMRRIRPQSTELSTAMGRAESHAESHLSAMLLMKAFNRGAASTAEYAREARRVSESAQQVAVSLGWIQPGMNLAAGLFAVALVWLLSARLTAGALGPGALVSFLMYGYFLARPVSQLASLYGQLQHARASAARVVEVLETEPEPRGKPGRVLSNLRGEIEFRRVHFSYPERGPVLNGVDLHIRAGETLALVGENGAGKTTLAHLLMRLAEPAAGEILLDGENLKHIDLKSLRAHIGLVPQSVLLLDGSIADNIVFGRRQVSRNRLESAARLAQAHGFIETLPHGYETRVGERGVKLSGGQRQRIAVARALLENPPLLILDEATAQFDAESEARFLNSLRRAFDDRTVLLITHRPAARAVADRVLRLCRGRVEEEALA